MKNITEKKTYTKDTFLFKKGWGNERKGLKLS